MKSFRLKFIDVDESFTTSTVEAAVKGYMICRAPKGTTEAYYFPYGNEKTINAMIGLQTANWPDLYEAIAFNTEYGLYISAPPGTASEYPSYYGGVYLTKYGAHDYWRVDDKDNPSFEIKVWAGYETRDYKSSVSDSKITIQTVNTKEGNQSVIHVGGISAEVGKKLNGNYFNLISWADEGTGLEDNQEVSYHILNGYIYAVVDDVDQTDIGAVGIFEQVDGEYNIYLGVSGRDSDGNFKSASNTSSTSGVPYLDLTGIFKYVKGSSGDYSFVVQDGDTYTINSTLKVVSGGPEGAASLTGDELVQYLLINGSSSTITLSAVSGDNTSTKSFSAFKGLYDRIFFRLNIKEDTFARISQKSPNETATLVTITGIGYEKYLYDLETKYILESDFEDGTAADGNTSLGIKSYAPQALGTSSAYVTPTSKKSLKGFITQLTANSNDNIIAVIKDVYTTDDALGEALADAQGGNKTNLISLWQYDSTTEAWSDVTADYKTKSIYISGRLPGLGTEGASKWYCVNDEIDAYLANGSIWYISDAGKSGKYGHTSYYRDATSTSYARKTDINNNTVTLSCKEMVYPGSYMSGGEFTGSLDEQGVNSEGTNIYWPNVLPESESGFIEVTPIYTFDELDMYDSNGYLSSDVVKIVDSENGFGNTTYTFTIKGQRTMTNAVQSNIDAGTLGCAWTTTTLNSDSSTTVQSVFSAAINEGIVEAQKTEYDDALVFMECSGQETFKSKLMSLRTTYHDTCTIISPKIITKSEFNNPATITVSGRSTGTAQYVGEFKMYDSYTGKNYWCQPIGDVGVNLARIMEKKLGGIAPAGTNDSQGLGGVLSRAVLDKKWDFNDDALKTLDEKGLNPITYDSTNGLMIQSQKTTQDPANETDWSYLGHSMSFDLCKREIRDNVMVKQLHKRISDYWYNIRTKQVQAILDKRITGSDPIWDTATVDIASVNTASTKAKRQFMITVKVKVYPYSNYVILTFVTEGQE